MKHRLRLVLLIIAAVLLIGIAVFAFIQRNNLKALFMSFKYSEDDLATLQEQAKEDFIEQTGLDREVLKKIDESIKAAAESHKGSVGAADNGDSVSSSDQGVPDTETDSAQTSAQSGDALSETADIVSAVDIDQLIEQSASNSSLPKDVQKLLYTLYSLQSQYLGQLDGIRAAAIANYQALPESEQTTSSQISIARAGVSQAYSLESQCDGRIAALMQELRAALRNNGLSDSLANSAEDYYATQKGLVKAEYMRKYNKYLK